MKYHHTKNHGIPKKRWCYTLHNPTQQEVQTLKNIPSKYHVIGEERGDKTGIEHLQGYVVLKGKATPKQIRNEMPRAHWENAKGKSYQASTYCKKGGRYTEKGKIGGVA